MIFLIQVCFLYLTGIILWCEHSPLFNDSIKSIAVRTISAISTIILCYQSKNLEYLSYETIFFAMLLVALLTFYVTKFIFKRYIINQRRFQLAQRRGSSNNENK